MKHRRRAAGFTLVEVLVALLAMALLATLAWQALDGMLRAREHSGASIDRSALLATVLTQWEQDLQALIDTETVPPIAFDGQTLRLTRRGEGGVTLVAWSVRTGSGGGRWQRWLGPTVQRSGELQQAWLRSQQLLGNEPGHVTLLEGADTWQVYFHRGGQWSNAQSSGDIVVVQPPPVVAPPPAGGTGAPPPEGEASTPPPPPAAVREALPDAVRLVITIGGQTLTRDIALGPT